MRTGNPVLSEKRFTVEGAFTEKMTVEGVVNKSFLMFALLLVSAYWIWTKFYETYIIADIGIYMTIGIFGGLIVALVTVFKPNIAHITAPVYAILEGLALGGVSAFLETQYPGIVIQAVSLTFAVFFSLLFIYRSGIIKVTENFKLMVAAATGGIFIIYLLSFVLGFFGLHMSFIHEGGLFGIIFSLVVIAIASMNLVLDFDFIEKGAEQGMPKYMEWYASFGLMVTLIWLYFEILRLIAKSRR
jgi:uncharacterized YccA/Bax inhibitor family protein